MLLGTGTDLVEIRRIEAAIARFGERFLARVFTPSEVAFCQRRQRSAGESFAARFAAKEAAAKALGTGIARGVHWREIEVRRDPGSRPTLHFSGRAALRAQQMGVTAAHLSLSHGRETAIAIVLLEGEA